MLLGSLTLIGSNHWNSSYLFSYAFVEKYFWKSLEILATSARVDWLELSSRIHMIFPSRSTSRLFALSKYLSIAFILTRSKEGRSNFCRSLTLGYPLWTFFIVVKKKLISSSVISLEGFCFFILVNLFFFLDLIKY